MRLLLLAVGRLRPYYREACDDYRRRLSRFATVEEIEVREAGRRTPIPEQPTIEAQHLLKRIPERATTIALTRGGSGWSSRELANRLEQCIAASNVVGVPELSEVKDPLARVGGDEFSILLPGVGGIDLARARPSHGHITAISSLLSVKYPTRRVS